MEPANKDFVETLFFDKFFLEKNDPVLQNWASFHNESFNKVQLSIEKNINFILNSVNALKVQDFLNKKLTFLDFGIPDILPLFQTNNISLELMSKCILHSIKTFEPRLIEPLIELNVSEKKPIISIKGKISKKDKSFFEIAYHHLK